MPEQIEVNTNKPTLRERISDTRARFNDNRETYSVVAMFAGGVVSASGVISAGLEEVLPFDVIPDIVQTYAIVGGGVTAIAAASIFLTKKHS